MLNFTDGKEYMFSGLKFRIWANGINYNDFEQVYVSDLRDDETYLKASNLISNDMEFYEKIIKENTSLLQGWRFACHIFIFIIKGSEESRSKIYLLDNTQAKVLSLTEDSFNSIIKFYPCLYNQPSILPIDKIRSKKVLEDPDIFNIVYGPNGSGKSQLMQKIMRQSKVTCKLITSTDINYMLNDEQTNLARNIMKVITDKNYYENLSYQERIAKFIARKIAIDMSNDEIKNTVIIFDSALDGFDSSMLSGMFDVISYLGLIGAQIFFTTSNSEMAREFITRFENTHSLSTTFLR